MAFGIKQAGGISFGVSMHTGQLARDTKKGRTLISSFVGSATRSLNSLGAAFGAAGLVMGINQSIKRIDALNTSAKTLGVTTENLSRLGFAASQTESSMESLISGMERMVKFNQTNGLFAGMSADQQFRKVAETIRGMGDANEQLAMTLKIFGRGSGDLVNVLRLSNTELDKFFETSDKIGNTVFGGDAEKVAKAQDAWERLGKTWEGVLNRVAIAAAKTLGVLDSVNKATGSGGLPAYYDNYVFKSNEQFMGKGVGLPQFDKFRQMQTGTGGPSISGMLRRLAPKTPGQIWQGLQGGAASAQRSLAGANFMRDANGGGKSSSFFADAIAKALNTSLVKNASQIFGGIKNSPIAQLQRMLFGANLRAGMAGMPGKPTKRGPVGDFNAIESGSLASYQQRIRGQQQFNKVEEKQLKVQEKSMGFLETIANMMPNFEAV